MWCPRSSAASTRLKYGARSADAPALHAAREFCTWTTWLPSLLRCIVLALEAVHTAATHGRSKATPTCRQRQRRVTIVELAQAIARVVGFRGRTAFDPTRSDRKLRALHGQQPPVRPGLGATRTSFEEGLRLRLSGFQHLRLTHVMNVTIIAPTPARQFLNLSY